VGQADIAGDCPSFRMTASCARERRTRRSSADICQGRCVADPCGLFNSSLDGNVRRAIDIHEGDKVDEAALKDLIRAAVALNLKGKR